MQALHLLALTVQTAAAGPVDLWGFGADHMGRGGGGVALANRPSGLFLNPAGLTAMPGPELAIGFAVLRTDLKPPAPVWWDTNRDGIVSADDPPLVVPAGSRTADAVQFSVGRPVGERFGLGVAFLLPVDRLLRIHTFEPSLPHYLLYEDPPHRYELTVGFGWEQLPGLSVGGAVQLTSQSRFLVNATLSAPVGLAEQGDDEVGDLIGPVTLDVHDITLELAPALVPMFSVNWDVGELIEPLDGLVFAVAYRGGASLPVDTSVDLQANFNVDGGEGLGAFVFSALAPIELSILDHAIPERWTLGTARRGERLSLFADVHRLAYDKLAINVSTVVGGGVYSQVLALESPAWEDGNAYEFVLEPTWNVSTGAEWVSQSIPLRSPAESMRWLVRTGVGVWPSPLVRQGPGTALLDADRFVLAAGAGIEHGDPFSLVGGPLRWEAFGQLQPLAGGTLLVETSGAPQAGKPVDGSGFAVGGQLWTLGGQATVAF